MSAQGDRTPDIERDPAAFWHEQFLYALSGLSWAVGKLGDEAGYAGIVHERLTHPTITLRPPFDAR